MSPGRGAALAAALVAVLCAGIWLGGHPENLPQPLRDAFVDDATSLTAEALDVIGDNYFREPDRGRLADASLDGMIRELRRRYEDRFSHYFDPEDLERFRESIAGRFSGVGMTVSEVPRGLRVGRVFPRSPAARAGIAAGDLIVAVDGQSIAGENSEVATARIKGPEGSEVTLGLLRPSTNRRRSVELTREEIRVPITSSRVRDVGGRRLGYVQLIAFTEGAHAAVRGAIERSERRGAEGIVLDLRGNGGGLLREAVLTASIFLEEGDVVVRTKSRTQGDTVYEAVGGDPLPPRPTVVLINRDTASAAEILASALAEDAGATIVGVRSYGKGVFQQVIELENGGALDLTIGEYFTADGTSLAGRGVPPDVRALDDPETRSDEGLTRAFRTLAAMTGGFGGPGAP
jgi:carboxyl-terminal processing protease